MRNAALILVVLIIFGITVLPFVASDVTTHNFESAANIIGAFSSFVTLIIALLLFNKFGLENRILNKNFKSVESLIADLMKTRILFEEKSAFIQFFPFKYDRQLSTHALRDYSKYKVVFSMRALEAMEKIADYAYDPFMPKRIAKAIKPLEFIWGEVVDINDKSKETLFKVEINTTNMPWEARDNTKTRYMHFNKEGITLEEYQMRWLSLAETVKKWLKSNAAKCRELNI